jgi:hypothetical protein
MGDMKLFGTREERERFVRYQQLCRTSALPFPLHSRVNAKTKVRKEETVTQLHQANPIHARTQLTFPRMVLKQQGLLLNQQESSCSSSRKKLTRLQMMEATRRRCNVPLGMVAASVL